ncbi:hypothetical protein, partial [Veillonella sp. 3627]|uniref:hypothetical protein n=1 Tax=Veillonella sp. 3627 TaxID=2490953 RepID=UPI001980F5BC
NTVVKLVNAESTWLETAWEDRKSLINKERAPKRVLFLFSHSIYYFGLAVSSQHDSSNIYGRIP